MAREKETVWPARQGRVMIRENMRFFVTKEVIAKKRPNLRRKPVCLFRRIRAGALWGSFRNARPHLELAECRDEGMRGCFRNFGSGESQISVRRRRKWSLLQDKCKCNFSVDMCIFFNQNQHDRLKMHPLQPRVPELQEHGVQSLGTLCSITSMQNLFTFCHVSRTNTVT